MYVSHRVASGRFGVHHGAMRKTLTWLSLVVLAGCGTSETARPTSTTVAPSTTTTVVATKADRAACRAFEDGAQLLMVSVGKAREAGEIDATMSQLIADYAGEAADAAFEADSIELVRLIGAVDELNVSEIASDGSRYLDRVAEWCATAGQDIDPWSHLGK